MDAKKVTELIPGLLEAFATGTLRLLARAPDRALNAETELSIRSLSEDDGCDRVESDASLRIFSELVLESEGAQIGAESSSTEPLAASGELSSVDMSQALHKNFQ